MWTSHVGLHEQCMAKVDIFSRSSSTLGEGGGTWPHAYLGNANCWFTVDIICQHLADSASTSRASNWSSDDALAAPMTDSSRLERGVVADWQGCVVTQLSDYDGVYHSLHGAALSGIAAYRIPHVDIQCAIDMIYIIIYIIMHGISF